MYSSACPLDHLTINIGFGHPSQFCTRLFIMSAVHVLCQHNPWDSSNVRDPCEHPSTTIASTATILALTAAGCSFTMPPNLSVPRSLPGECLSSVLTPSTVTCYRGYLPTYICLSYGRRGVVACQTVQTTEAESDILHSRLRSSPQGKGIGR